MLPLLLVLAAMRVVVVVVVLVFGLLVGHVQSRHSRLQSPHLGLTSSHFFLRSLQARHPVWTRRMRALGGERVCELMSVRGEDDDDSAPDRHRGLHGRPSRAHRRQGKPLQACLMAAQRSQTVRCWCSVLEGSEAMSVMERVH
jgi:hypothetical protein